MTYRFLLELSAYSVDAHTPSVFSARRIAGDILSKRLLNSANSGEMVVYKYEGLFRRLVRY